MKLKSRITRLEAKRPPSSWVPPIIFHSIIEPSDNGPKEVGAFSKIRVDGNDLMVWLGEDETKEDFVTRILAMQSGEH